MKMAAQAVASAAKKNWTGMGLYSLTFYGYIKANCIDVRISSLV